MTSGLASPIYEMWHFDFKLSFPELYAIFQYLFWLCPIFLLKSGQRQGEDVPGDVLHDILREIDTNRNGQVELEEYLAVSGLGYGLICFWQN